MSKLELLNDITAESGVIASLIINPELIMCNEMLKHNHFYSDEYKSLYWAITELYKKGIQKIDKYNLVTKISDSKKAKAYIDKVGGDKFIDMQLENAYALARESIEEYKMISRKVVELAFRRDIFMNMDKYQNEVLNTEKDLNEINSKIITSFDSIAEKFVAGENIKLYSERLDSVLEQIEEDQKRSADGIVGLKTKWDILSDVVRYEDGDLYIYGARRKAGKSLLLLEEGIDKASKGLHVLMTSTEMNDKKETLRLLSIISGIPIDDIKAGKINEHTNGRQRYNDAIHFIKNAPFTREYDTDWTTDKLLIKLKAMKHRIGGCDFIIHDYIKDVKSKDSSAKYNELGRWADFLKNKIAGGFDVPVLSAVQLNRNLDIADSDNIERYVTAGIKWIQKNKEEVLEDGIECGNYKMIVDFARDGGEHEEGDYFDFYLDGRKHKTNLRIIQSKMQHEEPEPEFIKN